MKVARTLILAGSLTLSVGMGGAYAQGIPVIDTTAIAKQIQQITEMQKQLEEARRIYNQAKELHDSFNQITNVKDLAGLLNNQQFQQYLPQEYGQYAGAVNDLIEGNVEGFAQKYDYYSREGDSAANDFYYQELQRRKGETYQDMAVGEAVYDTASKRMDALNELKEEVGKAETPKEVMDLQARIQAESALLQNELLRMRGLAMIQEARTRVDRQRGTEKRMELIEQIKDAAQGG